MDTRESYSSRGGRGGGRGGWYDNTRAPYDDRGSGTGGWGRGGGRARGGGGFYNQDQDWGGPQGGGRGPYNNNNNNGGWHPQGGRTYHDDNYQGGRGGGGRGGGGRGRGRQQTWGRQGGNFRAPGSNRWERDPGNPRPREDETLPADVAVVTELTGHSNKVTVIQYDPATAQLYTAGMDGSIRTWSTETGQCITSVDVGGEVDCLLLCGGHLFAGLRKGEDGIIKVWNMATGSHQQLTGHKNAIYSLVVANQLLFSAGQDCTIRVWAYNEQGQTFVSQAIITASDGGHRHAVHALQVIGNYMFSGDQGGDIVVWDLSTGAAVQRITQAHGDRGGAVMSLLAFESYLLSAGLDGLIRAWAIQDPPLPGMVLKIDPEFVFDKDDDAGDEPAAHAQFGRNRRARPTAGILTMSGTTDKAGKPVLMVAYLRESCVRMYELPSFTSRGVLVPTGETRSLGSVPGTVMLTGDSLGKVHVFQWKL